jgi:hypothetical protein
MIVFAFACHRHCASADPVLSVSSLMRKERKGKDIQSKQMFFNETTSQTKL